MEIPTAEAKKRLCETVNLAEAGETITILRHGQAVTRLMPVPVSRKPWRVEMPTVATDTREINIER